MANVLFKRGVQAQLPSTSANVVDGAFYLTTDTHRLYVGTAEHELKLLNQTVAFVASQSYLTNYTGTAAQDHENDLVYIIADNILATWVLDPDDNQYKWKQINPDTDTKLKSVVTTATAASNVGTISQAFRDQDNIVLTTASFSITGAGGINVTGSGSNLTLTGNTYSLGNTVSDNNATLVLSSTNATSTTSGVVIRGGDNVTIATTNTNEIAINVSDDYVSAASLSIPASGQLKLDLTRFKNGDHVYATANNVGILLEDGSYVPLASTSSATAVGAIYSQAQIDSMLGSLNGMTYKGTVGGSAGQRAQLPGVADNVKIGDTYIITESGLDDTALGGTISTTTGFTTSVVGDMLIATGVEDPDTGFITNSITWTYIPSGNDALDAVTYHATATAATNTIELYSAIAGNGIGGIQLQASTGIAISSTTGNVGNSTGKMLITSISHGEVTTTSSTTSIASATNISAISSITLDNGHITAIETTTYEPLAYKFGTSAAGTQVNATITEGTRFSSSTTSNDLAVTVNLNDTDNNAISTSKMTFKSESITLSASSGGVVVMNMEWGSF